MRENLQLNKIEWQHGYSMEAFKLQSVIQCLSLTKFTVYVLLSIFFSMMRNKMYLIF